MVKPAPGGEADLRGRTSVKGPVRFLVTLALSFALATVTGLSSAPAAGVLRVCADPDNMPFSNEKGEGFENKLAELIADRLGSELDYVWFSEASGYVPNTMGKDACDLVMGYAQGTGLIDDTNPYYYTSYVLIYRKDDPALAGVDRLSDSRLKSKRIGLVARTPPASILAMHGLVANAKPFEIFGGESQAKAAADMVAEIAAGKLDAGLLWGPVGGYYAQRSPVPLAVVPLVKERAGPSTIYAITMGVRPNDPQWKHKINKVIAENQRDINAILQSYDVPLMNPEGELIELGAAER
ncbi:MAG: quinoprotein dehydrogenase-associated putative ABC transporter substrate-binding protein [Alphaproteobacteria bacterium]|nr:quinoprotein dehydrogenase-associated putative ABC transporter substrate-binding protein [Alphaproteobacteria bacterium]